jgi:hypothetical protein
MLGGQVMVPLRVISERFGAKVNFAAGVRILNVQMANLRVVHQINTPYAFVNDLPVQLYTPAIESGGRILVSLKFLSDALGLKVLWSKETHTVAISRGDGKPKAMKLPPVAAKAQPGAWPKMHWLGPEGLGPEKLKSLRSPASVPLQPGDIVLRGTYMTNTGLGFFYTHCAIVGEDSKIRHLTGELFGDLTTLESDTPAQFWDECYAGAVIRPRVSRELRLKAARWVATSKDKVKFKLDASWPVDPRGKEYVNCSSFIERAYSEGAGVNLGLVDPVTAARKRSKKAQVFAAGKAVRGSEEFFTKSHDGVWLILPTGNLFIQPDGKTVKWQPLGGSPR